jgi:hypothetical protein
MVFCGCRGARSVCGGSVSFFEMQNPALKKNLNRASRTTGVAQGRRKRHKRDREEILSSTNLFLYRLLGFFTSAGTAFPVSES